MTDFVLSQGTVLEIKNSGGAAAITLASVANNAARQAVKLDLGATRAARYAAYLDLEPASAPTAGNRIGLYAGWSWTATAGSDNPGGTSGTDAAYKAAEETEWLRQLELIGNLIVTNDGTGNQQRQLVGVVIPKTRYVNVVLYNTCGVALSATEANQRIVLVPILDQTA